MQALHAWETGPLVAPSLSLQVRETTRIHLSSLSYSKAWKPFLSSKLGPSQRIICLPTFWQYCPSFVVWCPPSWKTLFHIIVYFFSCCKWEGKTSPCYSVLAQWKSFVPYDFILFLFYHMFSILPPPLLHCKNNNETAFLYENLLCARASITRLINIISTNHGYKLGLFFYLQNISDIRKSWKWCEYSRHLEVTMLAFVAFASAKAKFLCDLFPSAAPTLSHVK